MPPATQNGMSSTRATRATQLRSTERCLGTRRDVVEHELVGALRRGSAREFEDVAHDQVIAEAHALDDLAVAHVEAGDDALGKNGSQLLARRCGLRAAPGR